MSEPLPEFKGIGDREAHIKHYRQGIDALMHDIRKANNSSDLLFILKKLRLLMVVIDNLELEIRKVRREKKPAPATVDPNHIGDDDIARKGSTDRGVVFRPLRKLGSAPPNCPFHNEKTGSFTIYLDQNKFYCYGCSAGVDAIDFVMKRDSVDFSRRFVPLQINNHEYRTRKIVTVEEPGGDREGFSY